jgi:hypothetical protein
MMNDILQAFLSQQPQQVQVDEMMPMMGGAGPNSHTPSDPTNLRQRAQEAAQQAELLAAMQQQQGGGGGGGFFSKLFG